VSNLPPVLTITDPPYGQIYPVANATVVFKGSFTDPGTGDTHTCSASWDDGTTSAGVVAETNGSGTCTATHTYTAPGVYTISMTVTDDEGASDTEKWLVVVYDPNGGFVTGGGWIMSPPGAYIPDPSLSGRANFGFVSKYKKGATVPEGQTEFQFQTGNLNFHSSAYEWLVVAGKKAQYKGTGTINGSGNYGFMLTAWDESPDKFRIKITGPSGLVYDNKFNVACTDLDCADPQAIGGGSIVVHKG
jgi:PKD repeat protein